MIDGINAFYVENDTKLSWLIGPGTVCDKTKLDNDMIDHIGLVYIETKTKLLELIWSGAVHDEN